MSVFFVNTLYPDPLTSLGNTIDSLGASLSYAATRPSTNDYRVKTLIAVGAILVATGTCATLLGSYRASQGTPHNDEHDQPVIHGIISDGIARISGLGTIALGLLCTITGGASIILAQEAIFRLQTLLEQCPPPSCSK